MIEQHADYQGDKEDDNVGKEKTVKWTGSL
jgi:hypothetical protein